MKLVQGRWLRAVAMAVLLTVLGCTDDGGAPDPGGAAGSETPGAQGEADTGSGVGAQERLRLERALAQHTTLLVDAMRHAGDGSPRLAQARRALAANTAELSDAAGDVLDVDGFDDVWAARVEALLALARDESGDEADLATAQEDYGSLVAEAPGDGMSAEDATAQLAALDETLTEQAASYRDEQLDDAFVAQREAFSQAVRLGQDLVVAAGPAPEATAGAAELRSALQQLLGEHAALAVLTTRHAARGSQLTAPAGDALNGNSQDLAAALVSLYGQQDAEPFDEAWRDAIAATVDVAAAAGELDDDARRRARRRVRDSVAAVADALAAMTEDTIEARPARRRLGAYFRVLDRHSVAAADGRWRPAGRSAAQALDAGSDLGLLLADGIVAHRPDDFGQR